MYNVSGESIIRQLALWHGRRLRRHFPTAVFTTYSSEEPCFTSALPQILKSFGYKYASLKNPNTLWGGYTRAHGGELVNWVGPDGLSWHNYRSALCHGRPKTRLDLGNHW
jgi:alpha-mannosidase